MRLISLFMLVLFSNESRAQYNYLVEQEISHGEKWIISGPDGRYLCEAMVYCFSLTEGTRFSTPSSIWLAPVQFIAKGQTCSLWDCKTVTGSVQPQADVNNKMAAEIRRLEAQLRALETGGSAGVPPTTNRVRKPQTISRCTNSAISDPAPFLGNSDEIVVLNDGSVWRVGIGEYNYLYEYYSSVQICGDVLIIGSTEISVSRVR
jgi:hypothetical protein